EFLGPEYAGLHHQHQRGAAGDRPPRRIVGVEQLARRRERGGFGEFERDHRASGAACAGVSCANAARSRLANSFSMSLALERSTGWPMLPSLPASVDSTE